MKKNCKFCGKEFEANSNHQDYCKGPHIRKCPICGNDYLETNPENLKRPPKACSYKCRALKTKQTSIEKYGCAAPGNNPEARKKAIQTCLQNNGTEYALQSQEIRDKAKRTLLTKYGVDNAGKSKQVIAKRMETNRERYGEVLPFNTPECYERQHAVMMEKYGVPYGSMTPNCLQSSGHISKLNLALKEKIELLGFDVTIEKRIENKMFDLCLPEQKILIEIDPTYTHNSVGNHWSSTGVDKYYHRNKSFLAHKYGYQCIHIFDWDNEELIIEQIKPKIELDAHDFQVYKLTTFATNEFLNQNWYQGGHRGQLLCLGLVKDDQIYQVMTFGRPTYSNNHCVQLYRMCTRKGYTIKEGYDILSKSATEFGVFEIIAYSDIAKSTGADLEGIGMTRIRTTPPRKIWSKGKEYINSSLVGSSKCNYKSDDELLSNGWLPVYDCGQYVYEFK